MPTVVDAFLVSLGLDSKEFKAGVQDTKGEMKELQEEAQHLAEKTKEGQKQFQDAVKASSDAVAEFSKKSAQEAALAQAKLHELQQVASQPGAGKAAQSAVKSAAAAEKARAAESAVMLRKLQEEAKVAQQALTEFGMKAAQAHEELRRKMKEVEQEAKEMAEKLRENGEKGSEMFDMIKEHAIEFLGVMASIGALMAFTEGTIKTYTAMNHLSEETKLSVEEISKWQNAVVIAGGSAEGFNQSVKSMAEQLVAIEKGLPRAQRAMKAYQAAGLGNLVAKGKHTELTTIYAAAHEKFQNMEMAEAQTLGKRMGLDEATIRVLSKKGEAYEEFMQQAKEAGEVTAKQAAEGEKAEEAMNLFNVTLKHASESIINLIIPALTTMMGKLTAMVTWAKEHAGIVKAVFISIAAGIALMNAEFLIALPHVIMTWAANLAGAVATNLALISVAISAAAAWLAIFWPIGLVVAAIAGVVAVLVMLYKKFEGFRNVVDTVFGFVKDVFMEVGAVCSKVFGVIMAWFEALWSLWSFDTKKIGAAWGHLWALVADLINEAFVLISFVAMKIAWALQDAFRSAMEGIKSLFHGYIAVYIAIFHGLLAAGKAVWNGLKTAAHAPLQWIEDKLKLIGKVIAKVMGMFHKTAVAATAVAVAHLPAAPATGATQKAPVSVTSTEHPNHPANKTVPVRQPTEAKTDEKAATAARLAKFQEDWKAYEAKHQPAPGGLAAVIAAQHKAQSSTVKSAPVTNNTHKETSIGVINVNTQATDANGVAKDIGGAVKSHSLVDHADGGMA
jgi:hypothetical protein